MYSIGSDNMPTYSIKDYELFSQAKGEIKNYLDKIDEGNDTLLKSQQVLTDEAVFKGPAAEACVEPMNDSINNFKNISNQVLTKIVN